MPMLNKFKAGDIVVIFQHLSHSYGAGDFPLGMITEITTETWNGFTPAKAVYDIHGKSSIPFADTINYKHALDIEKFHYILNGMKPFVPDGELKEEIECQRERRLVEKLIGRKLKEGAK